MKTFISFSLAIITTVVAAPTIGSERLLKRQSFQHIVGVDDSDASLTYSGQWTHLTNQGEVVRQGTESYTNQSDGSVEIPSHTNAFTSEVYELTIYGGKKKDRGFFKILVGDEVVGTGDAYVNEDQQTTSEILWKGAGLSADEDHPIYIKNVELDTRIGGTPYLDFDYIELTFNQP